MHSRRIVWIICLTWPLVSPGWPACHGQETDIVGGNPPLRKNELAGPEARFLRLRYDDSGAPIAMETSVTTFVPQTRRHGDVRVDLVGAVHIADKTYYERLNALFRNYDVVLYELVAPPGTRIPKGGGSTASSVSYVQDGMTKMLGLAFQLKCIDYTCENLMHADLSPQEFAETMRTRGESFSQIFFRMMGQSMAQQMQDPVGSSDWKVISALVARDRQRQLKCVMAEQFAKMDGAMVVFSGPNGSTLISERNKKALSILRDQLNLGRKRIAIFYGAGHMADMEDRLQEQFQMKMAGRFWLKAWDLTRRVANR